jgi:uncharacterized protein (TIGR03435 family)
MTGRYFDPFPRQRRAATIVGVLCLVVGSSVLPRIVGDAFSAAGYGSLLAESFSLIWTSFSVVGSGFSRNVTTPLFAQDARPRFDAVTVKPSPASSEGYAGLQYLPGGVVRGRRVTIKMLIEEAYGLSYRQLEGDKNLLLARFEIEARADSQAVPGDSAAFPDTIRRESPLLREMLKSLLADRFKLTLHVERRDTPVYALVVLPRGPTLTPAARDCTQQTVDDAVAGKQPCGGQGAGPATGMRFRGVPLATFTDNLTVLLDRPVVDRTGITGRFDVDLPPWNNGGASPSSASISQEPQANPDAPSLFTLLQERLGLKLEPTRAMLDIYVVDHLERPGAN